MSAAFLVSCLVVVTACCCGTLAGAQPTVRLTDVFRGASLDVSSHSDKKVRQLGTRSSAARAPVVRYVGHTASTVPGNFVLVRLSESSGSVFPDAASAAAVFDAQPAAVLFLIARDASPQEVQRIESAYWKSPWSFPVLFERETANASALLALLESGKPFLGLASPAGGLTGNPAPLEHAAEPLQLLSVHLGAAKKVAKRKIAVVAHADTFGVAPGLVAGANAGSGAIALLELIRIVGSHTLPADAAVTFLLSTAGRHSYAGSRHWLTNVTKTASIAEDEYDLVVCLESIMGPGELYAQTAAPKADKGGASLHPVMDSFLRRLAASGDKATVVSRRIDLLRSELAFEHEVFAHRGMAALTLTTLPAAIPQVQRSSFGDRFSDETRDSSLQGLLRRIDAVAGAVVAAASSSDEEPSSSTSPVLKADSAFVKGLLVLHDRTARPALAFPSSLATEYRQLATRAAAAVGQKVRAHSLDFRPADVTVYNHWQMEVTFFEVRPASFEATLTLAVLGYLAAFAAWLSSSDRTALDIARASLFGSGKSKVAS